MTTALALTAGPAAPVSVTASVETPAVYDDEAGGNADADDPAVWVDPDNPGRSIVIGTLKEAGLDVHRLGGGRLQHIAAPEAPGADAAPGRFNNVDIVYGFELGGKETDLAVVSDRGRDRIRAYAIDPAAVAAGKPPLKDVTDPAVAPVFAADEAQVDEQRTAYGLTVLGDGDGGAHVAVSQREETKLRLLRLKDRGGRVGYAAEDSVDLPAGFRLPNGKSWTPCADPGERPQVEGMAFDQEEGVLYAAQEAVGLWRIDLDDAEFERPALVDKVREYGVPWTYDATAEECVLDSGNDPGYGGEHLSADAEGVTVYHAADGAGYVLASSQGDDAFAVYRREGRNGYVGSFEVADGATDGVQHSDGSTVVNVPVGSRFPKGLLVTHDGEATPADGDRAGTNFKFVRWDAVAGAFPEPLTVDTESFDPRDVD
ncbi:phytase [Streptomyces coryli]|nr:phytase [Streptomyces coryli]